MGTTSKCSPASSRVAAKQAIWPGPWSARCLTGGTSATGRPIRQYVDDMPVRMVGKVNYLRARYPEYLQALVRGLSELDLEVSPKSLILVSNGKLRASLAQSRGAGIDLTPGVTARDLGLDCTAGARRSVISRDKRTVKAFKRIIKLRALAKGGLRTRRYTTTAVMPQALWGHQQYGIAPTTLAKVRAMVAKTLPDYRSGCCTAALLAISLDDQPGPRHQGQG